MAYPTAPVTLIRASAPAGTFKQYPYSSNLRPYLLDPLLDRTATGYAAEHWLPTTGDASGLIGLSPDKHVLTPRTGASGVASITLSAGGSGYTTTPTVTIAAPPAGGVQATAIAIIASGAVTGFFVTNPGSGYVSAPAVTLSGGGGTGAGGTAVLDGRPTYGASSVTLKAGGVNGLLTDFMDQTPFSAFCVVKQQDLGAIYMGAGNEQSSEGGDFSYSSSSGLIQNNMRGSSGTGNLLVSGSTAIADQALIFVGISYDGTTRRLYTPGYALASMATAKTLAGRLFGFGNNHYKSSAFDQAVELMDMGFAATAWVQADFDALSARARLRQAMFGRTMN